ncbi:glucose-6-phosphate dehydrogenase assembly protein OpcA [Raineyella antarctica]|uniref:Glucose-6-phosphate dehydrogenase assembly protein OpcA n=1 Tax=Raineyella antarctica TaxID=1577474 RepID=A0A1G6GDW3_9ACTN|nr:glucose-6-phosphate dehydrogenase assembly protein OpcA [Raineyella antarctica]SDB80198.1 glucose-6-phosphate dehydrogenase assembly protein OpcA [Raineyella antarctica]
MTIEMKNTTAAKVAKALLDWHRERGSSGSGMVHTFVVATDRDDFDEAYQAALAANREHPSRILIVVRDPGAEDGLDAEIHTDSDARGDMMVLTMRGRTVEHPGSVLRPLLVPDLPVVVWWPNEAPEDLLTDRIGKLADRRITDALGAEDPTQAIIDRAYYHSPGDSDLAWTRTTRWRALLAAALDQVKAPVTAATVEAATDNAPASLLAAWLELKLGVEVTVSRTDGPGITAVRMTTPSGPIEIVRIGPDETVYRVPDQPERSVALRRRPVAELVTEELRRMDDDVVLADVLAEMVRQNGQCALDLSGHPGNLQHPVQPSA